MTVRFSEAVGATLAIIAVAVLAYASVVSGKAEALGALVAISAAATGYFLRSKVEAPKS